MATIAVTISKSRTAGFEDLQQGILRFIDWLDRFGETSFDFQSYYSSRLGRAAKALYYRSSLLGTVAVAPMIFSEAFVPSARRLFWIRQRFPIADAHYAMGFASLSETLQDERHYLRAVHFLRILEETRCKGYEHYCWGYPFDWETRYGTMWAGTPLITTVPYVYEAFLSVFEIDRDKKWQEIMRSIAEHALCDYHEVATSERAASAAYNTDPSTPYYVVNASAYRAFLLTRAAADFSDPRYERAAERNLNFVLEAQSEDGSWRYSTDGGRDFVDHFHTCFVIKALAKIHALTGDRDCEGAIERGVQYYLKNLFDESGLPKPFSRKPRLTVYKRELYDYAECINLVLLLKGRIKGITKVLDKAVDLRTWQRSDGSFRSRQLTLGWDNTPMHRWAQAQFFRSLCLMLDHESRQQKQEREK